jgi:exosortase
MSTIAQALEAPRKNYDWVLWPSVLLVLTSILYAPVLKLLILQWWHDPDDAQGFLVPLVSGYMLWQQRHRWLANDVKPSNFGLPVMLGAILLLFGGLLGAELFTSRFSLLILLAGMLLFLAGWGMLRSLAFPLGFLIFMIPIPALIYNQITFPLQLWASRFATSWLEFMRVPVFREGNILILPNYALEVVEACSGVRSLTNLIALAVAYVYLVDGPRWVRFLLPVLMIPVAIVSNALRIMGTGLLTYHFGPKAAEGFFHVFSGWMVFVVAVLLLLVCDWILRKIDRSERSVAHV